MVRIRMETLLQTVDLCKQYKNVYNYMAVYHMNLSIPRGKIVGILGPNGCGKSTLFKMINGLLTPTCGSITIGGFAPGIETKQIISYLPERTYLNHNMTVAQIIDYFADFYADFDKERAYAMLASLQIDLNSVLKNLSKGGKEKVQLILVMSRRAQLYLLDEPIAGVDTAARDYILRTILTNYDSNATILISTHLIADIENILDEVIFMKNGSLLLHTTVDNIRENLNKSVDAYFREVYVCSAN